MQIAFDLDDTLIDHDQNRIELARNLGYDIQNIDFYTKQAKKIISPADYKALKHALYRESGLMSPPTTDALDIIQELSRHHTVFIISRRQASGESDFAKQWIAKHLPQIPKDHIFFVDRDEDKNTLCHQLNIDFIIDDSSAVLEHITLPVKPILFDRYGTEKPSRPLATIKKLSEIDQLLDKQKALVLPESI